MENLNLEEFNPKMVEVKSLADKYRSLVIKDIGDVDGYKAVHDAQMELVHTRTDIVRASKSARENATDYNKAVLKLEKDLIAEIEPVEKLLKIQKETIDNLKEKEERVKSLPERKERLITVEATLTDDEIIEMDAIEFQVFMNEAKTKQLAAREAKIQAETDRLDAERLKLENEQREAKIREEEAEKARIAARHDLEIAALQVQQDKEREADRVAQATKLASDKASKDLQDAQDKAREEKQDIINANNAKRIADEELESQKLIEEEAKKTADREAEDVQNFLKLHGMTKDNVNDFILKQSDKKVVLFKKVGELIR